MYVDSCSVRGENGKTYTRHLMRRSYRDENGKPQKETIGNLTRCTDDEVAAIKLALKYKGNLAELVSIDNDVSIGQGLSVGAVWTLWRLAGELGIVKALGDDRQGKLALWQVMARAIDQGSRLSAVRLAGWHAACDVLDLDGFCEDHLYANLDWISENQAAIEDRLFRALYPNEKPKLFLYDVTSSYFEGLCNELAAFGYNRDGKKGKKQIVIGLLCDELGIPLSIEVFSGNTSDPKTFDSQVDKAARRFGCTTVTFVGDRGMIKSQQIADLPDGMKYITAITKPQIQKLVEQEIIQMELFDETIAEIETEECRYVLRRNPVRADEMSANRHDKRASIERFVEQRNLYLREHEKAWVKTARNAASKRIEKLKLGGWLSVRTRGRRLELLEDAGALAEESMLDGCYVIKTDLDKESASKETVHDRYKDLSLVEEGFRTCKTAQLENRPIHVRLESRTRGHVFVVMLAYRLVQELAKRWRSLDITVQEGLTELSSVCSMTMLVKDEVRCQTIPRPNDRIAQLLELANTELPEALPCRGIEVATRKKLTSRRSSR